jgi:serine/threonine protein kinase
LNHANVIRVYDVGLANGLYFFSMEFVDGQTVAERIMREGLYDAEDALEVISQIAMALEHAARLGVIHRDIKPENIMIDKEGHAKLADLGLAKRTEVHEGDAALTQEGTVMGTPHYMSPEQALDSANLDARTDLFSLGATLFTMLTGEKPFKGRTQAELLANVIDGDIAWPKGFDRECPRGVFQLLKKMMAIKPDNRHRDATDLIADLERVKLEPIAPIMRRSRRHRPISLTSDTTIIHRGTPMWMWGGAAAAAIVIGVILLALFSGNTPEEPTIASTSTADGGSGGGTAQKPRQVDPSVTAYAKILPKLMRDRDNYAGNRQLLKDFIEKYPRSSKAADARNRLKILEDEIKETYVSREREAGNLEKAGRLGEAMNVLMGFSEHFDGTDEAHLARAKAAKLRVKISDKFDEDCQRAERALSMAEGEGKLLEFAVAEKIFNEDVQRYGAASEKTEAERRLRTVDQSIDRTIGRIRKEARQALYVELALDLQGAVNSGEKGLTNAEILRDRKSERPEADLLTFALAGAARDFARFRDFEGALTSALKKRAASGNREVNLQLRSGKFAKGSLVEVSGIFRVVETLISLNTLHRMEVIDLAEAELSCEPAESDLTIAAFLASRGDYSGARKRLGNVDDMPGTRAEIVRLEEKINVLALEAEARSLYAKAERAKGSEDWKTALEAIKRLSSKKYARTRFVRSIAEELRMTRKLIELATKGVEKDKPIDVAKKDEDKNRKKHQDPVLACFNANSSSLSDDVYTFVYDFSDKSQLKDFYVRPWQLLNQIREGEHGQRSRFRIKTSGKAAPWSLDETKKAWQKGKPVSASAVNAEGGEQFYWKGVMTGDASVEITLVADTPRNIWFSFLDPGREGMGYAGVVPFDIRACGLYDAADADLKKWLLKKHKSPRKAVLLRLQENRGAPFEQLASSSVTTKKAAKLTIKMAREGGNIVFTIGKRKLKKKDREFSRGRFGIGVFGGRAHITKIVIKTKLDKEWANRETRGRNSLPKGAQRGDLAQGRPPEPSRQDDDRTYGDGWGSYTPDEAAEILRKARDIAEREGILSGREFDEAIDWAKRMLSEKRREELLDDLKKNPEKRLKEIKEMIDRMGGGGWGPGGGRPPGGGGPGGWGPPGGGRPGGGRGGGRGR